MHFNAITKKKLTQRLSLDPGLPCCFSRAITAWQMAISFTYYTAELVASSDTAEKYILSYM